MDKVLENRICLLIKEMTLEEKTGMIHGAGLFRTAGVERIHIPPLKMSDGPMGVRSEFVNDQWMPVGTPDDYVTYCPSNSAIAMTWNRKLARNAGKVLGEEARGRGKDVILAPGINIKRTPACGRNFEYISEDPRLTSELAVPIVRGIETSDVAACVKHFAMNNQETERLWVNVEADERTMREIYFPAFQAVVQKAGAKSIMGSYNLIRGTHVCENKDIMGTVLRKEWGFDGTIISDWGAVHTTKGTAEGPLDIEMSVTSDFDDYFLANPLISEIRKGNIDEACVDEKVRNILRMMVRLHMIELTEVPDSDGKKKILVQKNKNRKAGSYNTAKHRFEVLKVARESITLLKNEDRKLPLDPAIDKVLVIGQNAVISQAMGGGSAEIKALYEITPLLGISKFLGGNCEVRYARGYDIPAKKESDHNWQEDSLDASKAAVETAKETEDSARLRKEAVELAKEYKHVIYVGGLNHDQDLEGQDRADLTLPYGQDRLITELLEVRPDMTIVMLAGSPVSMKPWADRAKAIVWMSYSGMEGGTALAEVLFGAVNPSGKLAETLPEEIPECFRKEAYFPGRPLTDEEKKHMNAHLTQTYAEGIFVGYRYYEKNRIPVQFCFGHGLSYTDFTYDNLKIEEIPSKARANGFDVQLQVRNVGALEGKETVQLYLGEKTVSPENPVKELKAFEKICLRPRETKTVLLKITMEDFMHYDEAAGTWRLKHGDYRIYVGSSLQDIQLTQDITI